MERLTVEINNEIFYNDNRLDDYLAVDEMSVLDILSALRKLKTYEDAEEQGLILRLPCKVGAEVWEIEKLFWIDRKGCKDCLYFGNDGLGEYCDYVEDNYPSCTKVVPKKFTIRMLEDFGTTVFLTREEAEQALKQMKGE